MKPHLRSLVVVVVAALLIAADRYHAGSIHGGSIVGQPAASNEWGPLSFNDPIFTGMTNRDGQKVGDGDQSHISSVVTDTACDPVDYNSAVGNWDHIRATRRCGDIMGLFSAGAATATVTDSYFETCGPTGDHPDVFQTFVNGGPFSMTWTRVTAFLNGSGCGVINGCAIRNGDDGRISLLKLDHVYIKGPANTGGIRSFTAANQAWAGYHLWIDNLCFDNADGGIAPYNNGTITVDHYANVFSGCSIVGGQVVTGTPMACSSWVSPNAAGGDGTGTVIGCPN